MWSVSIILIVVVIASQITRSRSFTTSSSHHHHYTYNNNIEYRYHKRNRNPKTLFSTGFLQVVQPRPMQLVVGSTSTPLKEAITTYFSTPSVASFENTSSTSHLYKACDVFNNIYWNPSERFINSKTGILYRPEIVDEISEKIEEFLREDYVALGLIIKGPKGIGKSHSIINVVRKLQSTGNYLVTYIPDCDSWKTNLYLVDAICSSFGTSYDLLDLPYFKSGKDKCDEEFPKFINAIDIVLKQDGKQWVFVFDQINKIFARFGNSKDTNTLPFPFYMIKDVMQVGRITTVLSASADHELRHEGFVEYMHRPNMNDDEMQIVFSGAKNIEESKLLYRKHSALCQRIYF